MEREDDKEERARHEMVREQIAGRGIRDPRVLDAMRRVPRHRFVPPVDRASAYEDRPLPIGERQTISQPYIVGLMTEMLALEGHETVLEIGAGSGYQTAILAVLCAHVVAVERHAALAERARNALDSLAFVNVELHVGDGSRGWPERAPYDAILVAAGAPSVPGDLIAQLRPGGRLILPVGGQEEEQRLMLVVKDEHGGLETRDLGAVMFVPLIGAAGFGLPEDVSDVDV